jgi:hypothetical protein
MAETQLKLSRVRIDFTVITDPSYEMRVAMFSLVIIVIMGTIGILALNWAHSVVEAAG